MKVLVINCGSSSLKYQLIDSQSEEVLAKGLCERIGIEGSSVTHQKAGEGKKTEAVLMKDHTDAVKVVIEKLTDPAEGVIASLKEIDAVGHRIVHGGEKFKGSVVIDDSVLEAIAECNDLAPLHNPANLIGIEACEKAMPGKPNVAVFDTAFGMNMPQKAAMYAIIKKDFRIIASNRRLFPALFIVPLVLTIVLPSIFVITIHFVPDDPDITKLLSLLPETARMESLELTLSGMILNYILPIFFLIMPIMTASIMAASAFVGEKERHTLETLLYCPLTLKQIFQAKVWASFLLSMLVSVISFAAMFLVIETELFFLAGRLLIPSVSWLVVILLLSPAISLIAITLIVRGSAKAQSVEESQQAAVFLILPVILPIAGQFTGVFLMNVWILLGLGVICAILAWFLLQKSMGRFTYEKLLQ